MLEQRRADNTIRKTMLYRIVFESTPVKYAVFTLFCFLLLQPAAPVFADEQGSGDPLALPSDTPPSPLTPAAQTPPAEMLDEPSTIAAEESVENTATLDEVSAGQEDIESAADAEEESTTSASNIDISAEGSGEGQATSTIDSGDELLDTATTTDGATAEDVTADTTASTGETENDSTASSSSPETATSTGSFDEQPAEDTTNASGETSDTASSTTNDQSPEATSSEAVLIQHNSGTYAFDAKECATVGDGAFYCSTPKDAASFTEDGVFSAPDTDGDEEIFVRVNGKETQLTHNSVDDSAPYYDALSDRIVWHRSVSDRYQIVSYDLRTEEETQLTSTSYNNMEPVAYGDITIWQAWVGNNWEIMLFDGETVRQLTHNDVHDVSPHMRGNYIVWQTQFANGWQVAVYDQETGHIEYVKTDGGAKVENPRFVLVYDSTDARGDVQTVGYDPDQKVSFTLHRIPTDVPEKLPEPDQTGETRALIQNKQSTRDGELDNLDTLPQTGTGNGSTTASSTPGSHTLDLSAASSSAPNAAATSSSAAITDVVIPSYSAASSSPEAASTTAHIDDVVIPPQSATSSAEMR